MNEKRKRNGRSKRIFKEECAIVKIKVEQFVDEGFEKRTNNLEIPSLDLNC